MYLYSALLWHSGTHSFKKKNAAFSSQKTVRKNKKILENNLMFLLHAENTTQANKRKQQSHEQQARGRMLMIQYLLCAS